MEPALRAMRSWPRSGDARGPRGIARAPQRTPRQPGSRASPCRGLWAAAIAAVALSALACASGRAEAATSPIYKCVGADRGPIYTDQPCKGGEVVDIRPGNVDAAAVARLQVARDMLDRSAAARLAEQRRRDEQAALAAMMAPRLRDDEPIAADAEYSAGLAPDAYGWWYPANGNAHRPRFPHKPQRLAPHAFAPRPPFVVPRS